MKKLYRRLAKIYMFKNKYSYNPKLENWKMAWHGRDFELSHLWQRSIFITTFIILIYTGYGAIWLNFLKCNFKLEEFLFFIANIVSIFIAILGYILSLLYIMIGKGSKYWYERYEEYILDIEKDSDINVMYSLGNKKYFEVNESLLSRDAGKYSVSKINIMLGQISACIWFFILVVHSFILIYLICSKSFYFSIEVRCVIMIFIVVILISIVIFIPCFLKDKVKSNIKD